jgi:3-methyladenine DNA glycosylase AlkC
MSKFRTQAPWEFLLSASRNTLQSYELSRLAHAANLKKEITALLDQWLQENTAANLARWLIEQRQRAVTGTEDAQANEVAPTNGAMSVSDNFLAEHFTSPENLRNGS